METSLDLDNTNARLKTKKLVSLDVDNNISEEDIMRSSLGSRMFSPRVPSSSNILSGEADE
jgi:hypothetical protein